MPSPYRRTAASRRVAVCPQSSSKAVTLRLWVAECWLAVSCNQTHLWTCYMLLQTDAMLGTRGMLGGAVDKFKVVSS